MPRTPPPPPPIRPCARIAHITSTCTRPKAHLSLVRQSRRLLQTRPKPARRRPVWAGARASPVQHSHRGNPRRRARDQLHARRLLRIRQSQRQPGCGQRRHQQRVLVQPRRTRLHFDARRLPRLRPALHRFGLHILQIDNTLLYTDALFGGGLSTASPTPASSRPLPRSNSA